MPNRRAEIEMTPEEVRRFLVEQPIVIAATLGPDGWPHLVPLWYVMRSSEPWVFTYGKSQKVRNLERDARATLLVEAGRKDQDVRGVMLTVRADIHRDAETVAAVAEEIFAKYRRAAGGRAPSMSEATEQAVRAQLPKRVAVRFEILRTVSWDHSRPAAGYVPQETAARSGAV